MSVLYDKDGNEYLVMHHEQVGANISTMDSTHTERARARGVRRLKDGD